MNSIPQLLERFRRGPELVASALTGAAGPEVDFRPDPAQWSVRQIVAHLADAELTVANKFRRMLAQDNPTIDTWDQNSWAENLDYAKRKPSASLESFRRLRAENYELLKDLSDQAFQRVGQHPKRGETTVLFWLEIYAQHAEKHTEQIRRVREAYKAARTAKA